MKPPDKPDDPIAVHLPQGGALWPGLDRMAEVASGMQQLEWALARRAAKVDNDPEIPSFQPPPPPTDDP